MVKLVVSLHVLSAVFMGFYLLLPFLVSRAKKLSSDKLAGYANSLLFMNRIGQYVLLIALLTGGYLAGESGVSPAWIAVNIALVVIMFAMSGMLARPLKKLAEGVLSPAGKALVLASVNGVAFLLILILMMNRSLI